MSWRGRMWIKEGISSGIMVRMVLRICIRKWRDRERRVRWCCCCGNGGGCVYGKVSVDWWDRWWKVVGGGVCCRCCCCCCSSWCNFHRLSWTISASVHVSLTVLGIWVCFLWAPPLLPICSSAPSWLWVYFSAKSHLKTSPANCSHRPQQKLFIFIGTQKK